MAFLTQQQRPNKAIATFAPDANSYHQPFSLCASPLSQTHHNMSTSQDIAATDTGNMSQVYDIWSSPATFQHTHDLTNLPLSRTTATETPPGRSNPPPALRSLRPTRTPTTPLCPWNASSTLKTCSTTSSKTSLKSPKPWLLSYSTGVICLFSTALLRTW